MAKFFQYSWYWFLPLWLNWSSNDCQKVQTIAFVMQNWVNPHFFRFNMISEYNIRTQGTSNNFFRHWIKITYRFQKKLLKILLVCKTLARSFSLQAWKKSISKIWISYKKKPHFGLKILIYQLKMYVDQFGY